MVMLDDISHAILKRASEFQPSFRQLHQRITLFPTRKLQHQGCRVNGFHLVACPETPLHARMSCQHGETTTKPSQPLHVPAGPPRLTLSEFSARSDSDHCPQPESTQRVAPLGDLKPQQNGGRGRLRDIDVPLRLLFSCEKAAALGSHAHVAPPRHPDVGNLRFYKSTQSVAALSSGRLPWQLVHLSRQASTT